MSDGPLGISLNPGGDTQLGTELRKIGLNSNCEWAYPILTAGEFAEKRHLTLQVDITDYCQLRCAHCRLRTRDTQHMSYDDVERLMGLARDRHYESIVLSGGEPVLHPAFDHILELAFTFTDSVAVLTNGLTKLKPPKRLTGRTRLAIGISFDRHHFTAAGQFDNVDEYANAIVANLKDIVPFTAERFLMIAFDGAETELIFVERAFRLARQISAGSISMGRVVPNELNGETPKNHRIPFVDVLTRITDTSDIKLNVTDPLTMAALVKQRPDIVRHLVSEQYRSGCDAGSDFIFSDVNGQLYLCPYLREPIGHFKEVEEISVQWLRGQSLSKRILDREFHGPCGTCGIRRLCGGCRATAHLTSGDWLGSDPDCPLSSTRALGVVLSSDPPTNTYSPGPMIIFPPSTTFTPP